MLYRIILFTATTLLLLSCKDKPSGNNRCNCSKTIACTEEFRMINLKVENTDGDPVNFDSTVTYLVTSKEILHQTNQPLDSFMLRFGHVIVDDASVSHPQINSCDFKNAIFEGYNEGWLTLTYSFQVKHDCCHIEANADRKTTVVVD